MQRRQYHSEGTPSDQAIEWLARLRAEDVTPQETADFATWLANSTLNKRAFDEATELWQLLGKAPLRAVPQTQSTTDLRHYRRPYNRTLPLAAAASLLVACFVMVLQLTTPNFATGQGEQRRVVLADGSTVYLNTSSEISVSYSRHNRQIELHRGEVWFDVTSQPDRPFIVSGRYASIEAVGTAFAVRETPGFTSVGVTEGVVAVSSADVDDVQLLQEGQQSTISATLTDFQAYDASTALAWQRGLLIYDDVRLDELLADLNRYLPKAMTLNDDELADKRVSGVLYLEDQDAMLEALGKLLPIRWKSVSDNLIIITADG